MLVVIGLIVGAIFVGRDLIHAAQLRKVVSVVEKYEASLKTFQIKYNCIAGDCANATDFFGQAPDCGGATTLPSNGSCNGNGNARIDMNLGGPMTFGFAGEPFLAVQQLGLAGLWPMPSNPGNGSNLFCLESIFLPGYNVPAVDYPYSAGIAPTYLVYTGPQPGGNHGGYVWFNAAVGQLLIISTGPLLSGCAGNTWWGNGGTAPNPTFTCSEMSLLDTKMDDGMPATGRLTDGGYSNALYVCQTGNMASYQAGTLPTYIQSNSTLTTFFWRLWQ